MPNPNPPLISLTQCIKHKVKYPKSDWCYLCERDQEFKKILEDISIHLNRLEEFVKDCTEYNGNPLYDYEIENMIKIIEKAIISFDD